MTEASALEALSMNELKQHIHQERAVIELKQEDNTQLDVEFEAVKQERERLKQHISALHRKVRIAILPRISYDTFRLQQKTEQIIEEAEEQKTLRQQMEEMIPRKIEENEKELQRNQRLLREVEKSKTDWDVLERVAEMTTKFRDGQDVIRHVEVLDQIRNKYKERLTQASEKAQQLREEMKAVESKQNVEASEMGMKMSDLQEEKLRLQVAEDAAYVEHEEVVRRKKKHFGPAQIETAIVNIHDMAVPQTTRTDCDIITMLDRVQEFITDNYEILDQYAKQYGSL